MDRRLLIGVTHVYEKQEIKNVKSCLREDDHPLSVGLELPDDYKERRKLGIRFATFTALENYFTNQFGSTIIPLDTPTLADERYCIGTALEIVTFKTQKKFYKEKTGLEQQLTDMSAFSAPERTLTLEHYLKRYRRVAELIESGKNRAYFQKEFNDLIKASDKIMIKRIVKDDPEIVIIGGGHARNIMTSLPRYRYLQFASFESYFES